MENNTEYDYVNEDDFEDGLCREDEVAKIGSIVVPLFFGIVVLLSLVGNSLVLAILALYENLKSLTNIFILNLAISDLLFTVGLPFWAYYHIWGWTLGEPACQAVNFLFYAGFYSSIVFLVMMTVQHYMAVVHPLSDWERGQGFALIPFFAWVVSIAAALPAPITSKVHVDPGDPQKLYCEYESTRAHLTVTYEQNCFFLCAFLVMGFCYIRILQTIFKTRTNKRHCTIRLIFCIVVVFYLSWGPYNVVIFLRTFTHHGHPFSTNCNNTHYLDYAQYGCKLLAFSHCCLNPVFYVFVCVKFRNHPKGVLWKIFHTPSTTDMQLETCTPAACGAGQNLMGECGCGREGPHVRAGCGRITLNAGLPQNGIILKLIYF